MKGKSYEELVKDKNFAEYSQKAAEYERVGTVEGLAEARRLIRELLDAYGDEMDSQTKQRYHENSARILSMIGDFYRNTAADDDDDDDDIVTIPAG